MKNSLIIILSTLLFSQTEPIENLRENSPRVWTLTNAMIHTSPGNFIKSGSISIRNGEIEAVGRYIKAPKDAFEMAVAELTGRFAGIDDDLKAVL